MIYMDYFIEVITSYNMTEIATRLDEMRHNATRLQVEADTHHLSPGEVLAAHCKALAVMIKDAGMVINAYGRA